METGTPALGVFLAFHIDPDGNFRRLSPDEAFGHDAGAGLSWLHLDRRSDVVQTWLYEHSGLDDSDVDALLSEETRPRVFRPRHQSSLLVILRGLNNQPGAEPDDLVSMRLWVERHRVLCFSSRPLSPVLDVAAMLGGEYAPANAAELLAALATRMVVRMEPAIEALADALDGQEEKLDGGGRVDTDLLAALRRRVAAFRRFLGPQRDLFVAIDSLHLPWLDLGAEGEWREATNTLYRFVEELDALRERLSIIQDALNARVVARANRAFYALTVVAAFFVPLTFTTGLLGMNVGGIPGASSPWGFLGVITFLASWSLAQYLVFRRLRWL